MKIIENQNFWNYLEKLVNKSEIVIDRPKGKPHPNFKDFIYPLDYGYLKNTISQDDAEIDVWIGSKKHRTVDAIMCTIDLMKRDSEIKILIGCTDEDKMTIYKTQNSPSFFKAILINRY